MSTAIATEARYTPEDLLAMPDGVDYELVHGQLLERKRGLESSGVGGRPTRSPRTALQAARTWAGVAGRYWLSVLPP